MASLLKVKIEGLEPVLAKLRALPKKTQTKILRPLISKAGTQVLQTERGTVPVAEGWLKRSLGTKVRVYKGTVVVMVGPRTGYQRIRARTIGRVGKLVFVQKSGRKLSAFGKKLAKGTTKRPTKYAHLVEYGHGGPHPAPPHPFARPAWDTKKDAIKSLLETGIIEGIEREAQSS